MAAICLKNGSGKVSGASNKSQKVERPDAGYAWIVAIAACVINFIMAGLGRMSGILFVAFIELFKVDRRSASMPSSVRSSARNLLGPIVGILGQKYGVRSITMIGGIVASTSALSCFFATEITWITVFWGGLNGMGNALTVTLPQVIIGQYFDKYRTTASGMAFSGGCLGSFIFPVLLEYLIHYYGIEGTFLIIGGIIMHTIPGKTIVVGNKVHRPLLDETLVSEDLRVGREELNETPESKERVLRVLRKMLAEQNEFFPRTDEVYLMRFIRCRKFDCERAFKTIYDHYKFRKHHPDIYPLPSAIEQALRACIFNFLPQRDQKGRAIYVFKIARWTPPEMSYADMVAAGNLIAEYVLDNPVTQINGYVGIWDFKGFSFKHFITFCSPKHVILLTTLMQDRFPARFKIAYCVNCSSLVNKAWMLISPVMKEKFRKRIKIFGSDMKVLHQYLDPAILPAEYGGVITTPENVEIPERVLGQDQYVKYNLKFGFP